MVLFIVWRNFLFMIGFEVMGLVMSVSMNPGWMTLQRIPQSARVYAAARDSPSRAHFDAEDAAEKLPGIQATEPTVMVEPAPESFISGAQVWMPMRVPLTLTSNTLFHFSIEMLGMSVRSLVPTIFRSTWRAPAFFFTSATAASHPAWRVVSSWTKWARPP